MFIPTFHVYDTYPDYLLHTIYTQFPTIESSPGRIQVMPSHQEQIVSQTQYVCSFISGCTAYHAQGRLGGQMLQELPFFAHATEVADMDCGLIHTERVKWSLNEDERYFSDIPQQKDVEALTSLDYKVIAPYLEGSYKGGQYHHAFAASTAQATHATAFIVASALAPDYLALIPRWCLDPESKKAHVKEPSYYGPEIALTASAIEPFPPNWSPHIMPCARYLQMALRSLRDFTNGDIET